MSLRRLITYLSISLGFKITRPRKKYLYLEKMFEKVTDLEGDIVECGIGKGASFLKLATFLQQSGSARKLWGFDSFEGFPEPSPEDRSPRNTRKGEFDYINAGDVAKLLFMLGFKRQWIESHIKIVKGFFEDTLPSNTISKIALLHLDVDLYDSYKTCLQYLFPKVVKGGVVLFDEYANKKENLYFPGAKKAIDEYFHGTKQKLSRSTISGKYFLIKS